jgi:uncharacterized damage-inducible protein DinB
MKHSELIDAFEHGHKKYRQAIAGLSPQQMKAFPVPETWSIHQIVVHVADSHVIGADRMQRIIAMDYPILQSYDETLFTKNLHYHEQSIEDWLTIMELTGRQYARLLRCLPESAYARAGNHTEAGPMTLSQMLQRCVNHIEHHLKFVQQKREMVLKGKT